MAAKKKDKKQFKKLKEIYLWYVSHIKPIQKNKVVFSQFGGKGYGCNPKAICDEFLRRGESYDLVWLLGKGVKAKDAGIPEGVRVVSGHESLYELFTAKVWINNIHFQTLIKSGLYKRKGTIYLNTFHGGITLKNEGKDKHSYNVKIEQTEKEQLYHRDAEFVDYITCGCEDEEHVLKEFFYGNGEILRLGDARTDVLVNGSPEIQAKVREHYKIPEGTRLVIYAPTFRSDMSTKWYDLDYDRILDCLEEKYGCPWMMLIRLHPRLGKEAGKIVPDSPRYINASDYIDMQDLAVASDLMISDYSSVITDFMLTRKPAFMYVPDLEKYLSSRGMYYSMEELPFPYALTTDELIERMKSFEQDVYEQKVDKFMEQIGYVADGKAAERIVDFLIEKMN